MNKYRNVKQISYIYIAHIMPRTSNDNIRQIKSLILQSDLYYITVRAFRGQLLKNRQKFQPLN